jgi:thymidylate synthase (FAD)
MEKSMIDDEIKVLDKGFVRLVDCMGDDAAIVQKARVSYGDGTKTISDDKTLIRYLIRNKHTSPLEGVVFKFHIKAPIFVFRQWHRHRTWSYNEISGRYSKLKNEYYVPKDEHFTKQSPTNKQGGTDEIITIDSADNKNDWVEYDLCDDWTDFSFAEEFENEQEMVRQNYERFLGTGVRRELARINLPVAQYSEMYATVDLHNLFHFLRLRLDEHAQYEIRVYAEAILELIRDIVPEAVSAFEDYILNSMSLTAKEVICVNEVFDIIKNSHPVVNGEVQDGWTNSDIEKDILDAVNRHFTNHREKTESLAKLKKLFVYPYGRVDP